MAAQEGHDSPQKGSKYTNESLQKSATQASLGQQLQNPYHQHLLSSAGKSTRDQTTKAPKHTKKPFFYEKISNTLSKDKEASTQTNANKMPLGLLYLFQELEAGYYIVITRVIFEKDLVTYRPSPEKVDRHTQQILASSGSSELLSQRVKETTTTTQDGFDSRN